MTAVFVPSVQQASSEPATQVASTRCEAGHHRVAQRRSADR